MTSSHFKMFFLKQKIYQLLDRPGMSVVKGFWNNTARSSYTHVAYDLWICTICKLHAICKLQI